MKLKDVRIGTEFQTAEGRLWRVTDVGTRTLSAIVIETPDRTLPDGITNASWLNGPPYIVEEVLFDEKDIDGAFLSIETAVQETKRDRSAHPGFPHEVMGRIIRGSMDGHRDRRMGRPVYPFPRVLRFDRFDQDLMDVLHPYATALEPDGWVVKVYRLFDRTFHELPDRAFVALPLATEQHLRQARDHQAPRPSAPEGR